ncbi:MAG: insulinase family protein [Crocinitomicaceae bacterium]|nr:insulinase family protein [Crocinitomicaceae bacterium]
MTNRSEQPGLVPIEKIDFIAPIQYEIAKGVYLYHMKDVPNETSRFDLYFDAGKCHGDKGISAFTNGLLLSGTDKQNSVEINESINALGGFLESGISVENSVVSMYCLRENLSAIFDILLDSIENVAFIEKEVTQLLSERKQKLKISEEKVSYLAQKAFRKKLFSTNDFYASSLEEKDFDNITIDAIKAFHKKHYLNGLTKIVIVGDIEESIIHQIINRAKKIVSTSTGTFDGSLKNEIGRTDILKEGAIQSAIRVGRTLFNKNHEDYLDFLVLNTIIGDYFGSRLMTNIREDKGYTYGIGSMIAELNETGYFLIATEVGVEVKEDTLKEIRFELEKLQNELVPEDELQLVKNYMLGQLLKSADGPYAMTDLFLSVELHGHDLDFYNEALKSVKSITPERIRELAQRYFKWDEMSIVTAG